MKTIHISVTYTNSLLGTASADPELHSKFIASKAPDAKTREEEIADLGAEEVTEKAMTVFMRDTDGTPFTYDYTWKGYFKESCGMLRRAGSSYKSSKLRAYKKEIDGLVFVKPRKVKLILPEGGQIGELQRPLRASTPSGERIALAHSELVPEGTMQKFKVLLLKDELEAYIKEWLEYGELHGTGQWRNAGYGSFVHTAFNDNGDVLWSNE